MLADSTAKAQPSRSNVQALVGTAEKEEESRLGWVGTIVGDYDTRKSLPSRKCSYLISETALNHRVRGRLPMKNTR